jgi:hypothetical protein
LFSPPKLLSPPKRVAAQQPATGSAAAKKPFANRAVLDKKLAIGTGL